MNKRYKQIVGVCLALGIFFYPLGIVQAQVAPVAPPPGSTLEQRIAQRKAERKIALADKDQKRLISLCKAAQEASRKIQRETTSIIDKRKTTYRTIDGKLWIINGQLKLAGKDTFNLEKSRAELENKAAGFITTAANYQQALDDLVLMNCQADIVGFKSIIETARLYYSQLQAQSADIRTHIVNIVKPLLADYAAQLQPKTPQEGS